MSTSNLDIQIGFLVLSKGVTLEEIKSNWTKTDEIVYLTPEIKLASLIEAKTKVIAEQ